MTDLDGPGVISDEEVKAPPSTEKPQDVPAPDEKPDEDLALAEDTTTETVDLEEPEQPKKSSGYARLKARHQAVLAELDAVRRAQTQPQAPQEREPKVEDFNGDYLAYEKASVAFVAKQAIREELAQARAKDFESRQTEHRQETLQDFVERAEEFKTKIKDYDESINTLYGQIGTLNPTLRDLIAESDQGHLILYQLAKNPGFARDLNVSGPLDQAREIGKLEAKLSLPRKETKAPPPITSPRGGAAPPSDPYKLAAKSDDISDYVKFRRKMDKTE